MDLTLILSPFVELCCLLARRLSQFKVVYVVHPEAACIVAIALGLQSKMHVVFVFKQLTVPLR